MKRIEFLVLFAVIFLGFIVRLYRIDNPIADWHAWRQADTSSVSRTFVKEGFDLLHPKYDDISNIASGLDNPEGYRFVEFPIYNIFQAGAFKLLPQFTLEKWGRLITVISSLFSILFLYLIVKRNIGQKEAFFSASFFAFLPFSIYFSRVILPDQMMVTASLGSIYFFDKWIEESSKFKVQSSKLQLKIQIFYVLSIIFTASAFLLKPYTLFFVLPLVYLAWRSFGLKLIIKWQVWLFALLSIIPLIAWRYWMMQYPEGIPGNAWLFNGGDIRFKGSFFYWIFGDRISRLILGYLGTGLLVFGFLKGHKDKGIYFALSFLISSLLYLFIMARGNVQHDYYQILIVPTVCIFLGRGVSYLLSQEDRMNKVTGSLISIVFMLMMIGFSWYFVRDYFNVNNLAIVEAGKKADEVLPWNAKVIVPYDGDTSFLYYVNRKGWPAFEKAIDDLTMMGATHLVIANPTKSDYDGFGKQYQITASSEKFLILKLVK